MRFTDKQLRSLTKIHVNQYSKLMSQAIRFNDQVKQTPKVFYFNPLKNAPNPSQEHILVFQDTL